MTFNFKSKLIVFFIFYFLFRILIFNINSAEWGDSYRILRATNFLEKGSYPKDEKRPPLFSAFLTLIPNTLDPVFGARLLMTFVSIVTVYAFYLVILNSNLNFSENQKFLSLILFAFNPLFVYWSMRVYADTFFLMICLFSFVLYFQILKENSIFKLLLLSFLAFFGIMTRFEGYILVSAIFLGFIYEFIFKRKIKTLLNLLIFLILGFALFFTAINTPWTFFKNPISSSYVDEAGRRTVGLYDILGYFLHVFFVLGNLFTCYFIFYSKNSLLKFVKENFILFVFLGIELVLAFIWPAAVPRLLVQIVPILILLLVNGYEFFKVEKKSSYFYFFPLAILVYIFGQFLIKSQFLLTNYFFMAFIILFSLIQFFLIYKKKYKFFEYSLILGTIVWMGFFIYLHKDIYKVLNNGVQYFSKEYKNDGIIVTNDVSALTKFYFADNLKYLREVDFGIDIEKYLRDRNARYIIVTNEHNPNMEFTASKYPYLETIYEQREEVNGKKFFIVISKVNLK